MGSRRASAVTAFAVSIACIAALVSALPEQGFMPGGGSTSVPAMPVVQEDDDTCRLDLSSELFGGVEAACGQGRPLDRSRCCPVVAAWLYAAHARAALEPATPPVSSSDLPVHPESSQTCVNALQTSLQSRGIEIPQPNASCDAILCFCGVRLHRLGSLHCPAASNLSAWHRSPLQRTSAVRALEADCMNPSYQGCTRCLQTLQKLKGRPGDEGYSERTSRMYSRDCQLMGLTWLLARNKTAYIPTVSAVLRAIMYSSRPSGQSECSPDQQNMPLAVDSLQLYQTSAAAAIFTSIRGLFLLLQCICWFLVTLT